MEKSLGLLALVLDPLEGLYTLFWANCQGIVLDAHGWTWAPGCFCATKQHQHQRTDTSKNKLNDLSTSTTIRC